MNLDGIGVDPGAPEAALRWPRRRRKLGDRKPKIMLSKLREDEREQRERHHRHTVGVDISSSLFQKFTEMRMISGRNPLGFEDYLGIAAVSYYCGSGGHGFTALIQSDDHLLALLEKARDTHAATQTLQLSLPHPYRERVR